MTHHKNPRNSITGSVRTIKFWAALAGAIITLGGTGAEGLNIAAPYIYGPARQDATDIHLDKIDLKLTVLEHQMGEMNIQMRELNSPAGRRRLSDFQAVPDFPAITQESAISNKPEN